MLKDRELRRVDRRPSSGMELRACRMQVVARLQKAGQRSHVMCENRVRTGEAAEEVGAELAVRSLEKRTTGTTGAWIADMSEEVVLKCCDRMRFRASTSGLST